MPEPTATATPAPMTATQRMTLVATSLGLFMIFLDALIVNVALPDIQASFDVGESGLQWVVAAYSVGMAVFMMSAATVADLTGRRRLYVLGLVVFTLASVASGLAPSMLVLNVARGVQGVAAAAVNVTSLALVSAAFPEPTSKARAIGLWTAIASVATAVGPTVGGLLTESLGWRSVFLVNVPVGVVAVVLTRRGVVESRDPAERSFDPVGNVLFVVAIGAFAYAAIQGPERGWASPLIVALGVTSVVALAAFVRVELRSADPMMDVRLFGDRTYRLAIVTIFVAFFSVYGMLLVVTQYFQNVRDFGAAAAGLLILPFSVGVTVCSPLAGRLVGRIGSRTPILVGICSLLVGFAILVVGVDVGAVPVSGALAFVGVGAALVLTPITSLAMSSVPPERAGMASGIMSSQRAIGSTVGFAVLGSILAVVLGATLDDDLATAIPGPTERTAVVDEIIAEADPNAYAAEIGPGRPIPSASTATEDEIRAGADDAFVEGIQVALGVATGLLVLVLVAGWRGFPRGTGATHEVTAEAELLEVEEALDRGDAPDASVLDAAVRDVEDGT